MKEPAFNNFDQGYAIGCRSNQIFALILVSYGYLFFADVCFQASNYSHSKSFIFSEIWSPISQNGVGLHLQRVRDLLHRFLPWFSCRTSAYLFFIFSSTVAVNSNFIMVTLFLQKVNSWAVTFAPFLYDGFHVFSEGFYQRIFHFLISISSPILFNKTLKNGKFNSLETFRSYAFNY